MQALAKLCLTAIFAYSTHYGITKAYSEFCVPDGIEGFLRGMLTTGSPVCTVVFNAMSHTQASYGTILLTSLSSTVASMVLGTPHQEVLTK
jgi:hypothetical protein